MEQDPESLEMSRRIKVDSLVGVSSVRKAEWRFLPVDTFDRKMEAILENLRPRN